MTDVVQLFTTLPRREQADEMARQLVDSRLAACVQVLGPLGSTYRWEGKLEQAEEWLLIAKTTAARQTALQEAVLKTHPYDVPEVLIVPVVAGNPRYLEWVQSETGA